MSINIESIKKELLNNKHPNLGMAQFKNDERIYGSIAVEALKLGNVRKWSELIVAFVFEANGGMSDNAKKSFIPWIMAWGITEEDAHKMCAGKQAELSNYDFLQNHELSKRVNANCIPNILCHGLIYSGFDGFHKNHFDFIYKFASKIGVDKKEVDQIFVTLKMENDLLHQFDNIYKLN